MAQKNNIYLNQAYRPDAEVKLTGEQFTIVRRAIQELRESRLLMTQVNVEGKIYRGQTLSQNDVDIEQLLAYVDQIHKAQVDAGVTVDIETLKAELEAMQKESESKPETKVAEHPKAEEAAEAPKEEVSETKKVKFKDEAETKV